MLLLILLFIACYRHVIHIPIINKNITLNMPNEFIPIPFEMDILNYCNNSKLSTLTNKEELRKGKIAIQNDIECIDLEIEDSDNKPAIKLYLKAKDNKYNNINGIYISRLEANENIEIIEINGIRYVIILQPKRTYLPFMIEL